jgi:hypothetical protein
MSPSKSGLHENSLFPHEQEPMTEGARMVALFGIALLETGRQRWPAAAGRVIACFRGTCVFAHCGVWS